MQLGEKENAYCKMSLFLQPKYGIVNSFFFFILDVDTLRTEDQICFSKN